ncbi:hypothetical protein M413DRAFT_12187 [Hebeloma cylindrosporum]|uniref:Uncharacterized protein n=1 Tax=Hebeloma cylindrosporum TaxID=76867 RepID=A0A0C2XPX4_HEBCY|nr:hypothetical protein M413DRAFT_12187 [Hebeloma cylindrosporum h7]
MTKPSSSNKVILPSANVAASVYHSTERLKSRHRMGTVCHASKRDLRQSFVHSRKRKESATQRNNARGRFRVWRWQNNGRRNMRSIKFGSDGGGERSGVRRCEEGNTSPWTIQKKANICARGRVWNGATKRNEAENHGEPNPGFQQDDNHDELESRAYMRPHTRKTRQAAHKTERQFAQAAKLLGWSRYNPPRSPIKASYPYIDNVIASQGGSRERHAHGRTLRDPTAKIEEETAIEIWNGRKRKKGGQGTTEAKLRG